MNAPSNMKYDHLYQTLVAEGHPALELIERAESEGFALASKEYANQIGLGNGSEFETWVERKESLQREAEKIWERFDDIVLAEAYYGEKLENKSIVEILDFVKTAIRFIDDSRF